MPVSKGISQGRDEIFLCGFHQNMSPSSGEEYIKAFFLNPDRKKVIHEKHRGGAPEAPPLSSRGLMAVLTAVLVQRIRRKKIDAVVGSVIGLAEDIKWGFQTT